MRAGVYVRISRDREGLAAGVERQEADCRALAESRGWQIAAVYADNDVSATDRRKVRKAYRRMLDDLRDGRLDAVVAYSSSRLYRRARDLEELIALLERNRAEIATVVSGRIDLSTADGRMMARMLAAMDQGEAERIGERSARAKAELKQQGAWLGGGAPAFGYERVKDERGKVTHRINEVQASVLRECARRALDGESLNRLAVDLNDRGIATSRGGRWQPSKLRATLTSPFHAGRYPDGTRGSWPAIFSDDQHLLLRALFPARRGAGRGRGERPGRKYVLSGIAFCSECGRKLLGSGGTYRCMPRNGGCSKVRIVAHAVDRLVIDAVMDSEAARARYSEPRDEPPKVDPSEPLLSEIDAIERRRLEAREAVAAGTLSLLDFQGIAGELTRRRGEVEARIREVASGRPPGYFASLLDDPTVLDLNEFIGEFVERVVVSPALRVGRGAVRDVPARVKIEWRSH